MSHAHCFDRSLVRVARVSRLIEEAFVAYGDQVVAIDGLDEGRHLGDPVCDRLSCALTGARPAFIVSQ